MCVCVCVIIHQVWSKSKLVQVMLLLLKLPNLNIVSHRSINVVLIDGNQRSLWLVGVNAEHDVGVSIHGHALGHFGGAIGGGDLAGCLLSLALDGVHHLG